VEGGVIFQTPPQAKRPLSQAKYLA